MNLYFETISRSSVPVVPPETGNSGAALSTRAAPVFLQNSSNRATRRVLAAVRSGFKSFNLKQAVVDALVVFALALFIGVTSLAVVGSIFILAFVSL